MATAVPICHHFHPLASALDRRSIPWAARRTARGMRLVLLDVSLLHRVAGLLDQHRVNPSKTLALRPQ
jgi:hypothetical protein